MPQGGGPREGHRCPGEAPIQTTMPLFLAWFTRGYHLAFLSSVKGGGIGPLPGGGVRVTVTKRAN